MTTKSLARLYIKTSYISAKDKAYQFGVEINSNIHYAIIHNGEYYMKKDGEYESYVYCPAFTSRATKFHKKFLENTL